MTVESITSIYLQKNKDTNKDWWCLNGVQFFTIYVHVVRP